MIPQEGNEVIKEYNIIVNGGEPLPGCPNDWDEAWKTIAIMNGIDPNKTQQEILDESRDMRSGKPSWIFDCGFKLDYDGGILTINSRFYPPKAHYGDTWDGSVHIELMGKHVESKSFDCPTLEELKKQVDEYVNGIITKIENLWKEVL